MDELGVTEEDIENLSEAEKKRVLELVFQRMALEAKDKFLPFIHFMDPHFCEGRHHQIIAEHLEALENNEFNRLAVWMPPRSGKSFLISKYFPAWFIGRHPRSQILAISYSIDQVKTWGRQVRSVVQDKNFQAVFPGVQVSPDFRAADQWTTTDGGIYNGAGITGGIAGKGASLGIIDDPINEQDAYSVAALKHVQRWYPGGFRSRLMPNGKIVLTQCMTGDTQVLMGDKTWKPLSEIEKGDLVETWNDGQFETKTVLNSGITGNDPIYTIKTGNHTVRCNNRHPFLVWRPDELSLQPSARTTEWVKAEDLVVGDKLVVAYSWKGDGKEKRLSKDDAWLLGFMLGDGWVVKRHRRRKAEYATCVAKGIHKTLNEKVIRLFKSKWGVDITLTNAGYYRTDKHRVGNWLARNGLKPGVGAKDKRIPSYIYRSRPAIREAFLSGFVAADGMLRSSGRVEIGLANRELVADVKRLAMSLGYKVSNISEDHAWRQPPNSPTPVWSECFRVSYNIDNKAKVPFESKSVTSISIGASEDVYDLEVEDNANFIAEGLVVHNTRWNLEDLSGWLTQRAKENPELDQWKVLKIPGLLDLEAATMLGWTPELSGEYSPDTTYWPPAENPPEGAELTGWSTKYMKQTKLELPENQWQALYMQNPIPEGGAIFKDSYFQSWVEQTPPDCDFTMFSIDTAYSKKQKADFSAISYLGTWKNETGFVNLIGLGAWKGRWSFPEQKAEIIRLYHEHKPDVILVEEKATGKSIIDELRLAGLPVAGFNPGRDDKATRAHACCPYIFDGRFWLPAHKEWANDLRAELLRFTGTGNEKDDWVDTVTQAIIWLRQNNLLTISTDWSAINAEDWEKQEAEILSRGARVF